MANKKMKGTERKPAVDPGYLMLAIYLISTTILVLFAWCGAADALIAGERTVTLDEIHRGQLLLPGGEEGRFLAAPMLTMDVDIRVSGIVARTTVKQQFKNDSTAWVEAMYVFPLPDESAVDHMQMQIGNRIIVGEIREKQEARKTYEAAKKAGKKTSLLSQQLPNMFTTRVANIAPGETVTVQIEYQQGVQRQNTLFSLRFPMVIGPRYQPGACSLAGPATISRDDGGAGMTEQGNPGSPTFAAPVFPPVIAPGEKPVNPVSLHVELAAGMELSRVDSLYHGIIRSRKTDNSIDIRFNGEVKADRDFVLEWEPEENQAPVVTLFSEQKCNDNFMLIMVMPPEQQEREPLARETVFILDTSGSMGGESIRQAKKALQMAVARMRPQDRFNVIEFNSRTRALFSASRPGSPDNLQMAYSFIDQLEARGGTEIKPALKRALDGRHDHERIRQVVFLTDGCVSNEKELFALIHKRLGDTRLFTVGIGSAPNSYFMTRAAAMGRGSFTFIGKLDEVQDKMTALFAMLKQPVITDLVLSSADIADCIPSPLPDLYQGEPLIAMLKSRGPVRNLQLSGLLAGRTPWQVNLDTSEFADRPGIAVLWARKKIRMLMDSLAAGADPEQVKQEIIKLALQNHLVSRYTSLVAVEQKISRPGKSPLQQNRLKTNLPAGWQYDKVFAGSAATATPSTLFLFAGLFLFIMAGILTGLKRRGL